ncbi:MAG: SDR family NAD(P)-dependent oxidoreductase [Candidatus Dormibacteria bacterium]
MKEGAPGGPLAGRVAVVTGAGRGIGRAEALCLASRGAAVVVNDQEEKSTLSGEAGAASSVATEIRDAGGVAVEQAGDVGDPEYVSDLFADVLRRWGRLDIVVNNAGFLRDRMLFNMALDEWDDTIRVHLRGHFLVTREACRIWRQRPHADGSSDARLINTTSTSGLLGNVGQANYGAAKAGVAALTLITSMEMRRYGVAANAVAPVARTRLTARAYPPTGHPDDVGDRLAPIHVAYLVAYLSSAAAAGITGQVFGVCGGQIELYEGWRVVSSLRSPKPLHPEDLEAKVPQLLRGRQASYEPPLQPGAAGAGWDESRS